jgi:hypothetical protein
LLLRFVRAGLANKQADILQARAAPIKLPAKIHMIVPKTAPITYGMCLWVFCACPCPAGL